MTPECAVISLAWGLLFVSTLQSPLRQIREYCRKIMSDLIGRHEDDRGGERNDDDVDIDDGDEK